MRILITKNGHAHYDAAGEIIDSAQLNHSELALTGANRQTSIYQVRLDNGEVISVVEGEFKLIRSLF